MWTSGSIFVASSSSWFRISYEIEGQTVNRVVDLNEATVGRSIECDIVVPARSSGVGRNHAVFRLTDEGWIVHDNFSRNGTFVNSRRVQTSPPLKFGDTIRFGAFSMRFEAEGNRDHGESGLNLANLIDGDVNVDTRDIGNVQVRGAMNMAKMSRAMKVPDPSDTASGLYDAHDEDLFVVSSEARLFHLIGESLVSSTDLNDMLGRILQTVFECVPARSGMVALRNESGKIVPRVSRSEGRDPVRVSSSIIREAVEKESALLIDDTENIDASASIGMMNIQSAVCVPLYNRGTVSGVIYVETNNPQDQFTSEHLEILSTVALFSAVAIQQAAMREAVVREQNRRDGLSRYFSPSVVEQIIQRSDSPDTAMQVEERDVSVLFADLKGFTAMSETIPPADVVTLLNEIWDRMNIVVFRHYGAIDKFMGDGMMAFFGAPLAINQHAIAAVRAGLEMQAELERLNQISNRPQIAMRIGINSGPVVMGDIGSESRKDFTVIGDTVNVASRLESTVAAPGQVIIGPDTYAAVSDVFRCRACMPVPLQGKSQAVQPWQVFP